MYSIVASICEYICSVADQLIVYTLKTTGSGNPALTDVVMDTIVLWIIRMLAFYIVSIYAFVILKLKCAIDKEIYLCAVICIGILHCTGIHCIHPLLYYHVI
jgi:hypothetical protein